MARAAEDDLIRNQHEEQRWGVGSVTVTAGRDAIDSSTPTLIGLVDPPNVRVAAVQEEREKSAREEGELGREPPPSLPDLVPVPEKAVVVEGEVQSGVGAAVAAAASSVGIGGAVVGGAATEDQLVGIDCNRVDNSLVGYNSTAREVGERAQERVLAAVGEPGERVSGYSRVGQEVRHGGGDGSVSELIRQLNVATSQDKPSSLPDKKRHDQPDAEFVKGSTLDGTAVFARGQVVKQLHAKLEDGSALDDTAVLVAGNVGVIASGIENVAPEGTGDASVSELVSKINSTSQDELNNLPNETEFDSRGGLKEGSAFDGRKDLSHALTFAEPVICDSKAFVDVEPIGAKTGSAGPIAESEATGHREKTAEPVAVNVPNETAMGVTESVATGTAQNLEAPFLCDQHETTRFQASWSKTLRPNARLALAKSTAAAPFESKELSDEEQSDVEMREGPAPNAVEVAARNLDNLNPANMTADESDDKETDDSGGSMDFSLENVGGATAPPIPGVSARPEYLVIHEAKPEIRGNAGDATVMVASMRAMNTMSKPTVEADKMKVETTTGDDASTATTYTAVAQVSRLTGSPYFKASEKAVARDLASRDAMGSAGCAQLLAGSAHAAGISGMERSPGEGSVTSVASTRAAVGKPVGEILSGATLNEAVITVSMPTETSPALAHCDIEGPTHIPKAHISDSDVVGGIGAINAGDKDVPGLLVTAPTAAPVDGFGKHFTTGTMDSAVGDTSLLMVPPNSSVQLEGSTALADILNTRDVPRSASVDFAKPQTGRSHATDIDRIEGIVAATGAMVATPPLITVQEDGREVSRENGAGEPLLPAAIDVAGTLKAQTPTPARRSEAADSGMEDMEAEATGSEIARETSEATPDLNNLSILAGAEVEADAATKSGVDDPAVNAVETAVETGRIDPAMKLGVKPGAIFLIPEAIQMPAAAATTVVVTTPTPTPKRALRRATACGREKAEVEAAERESECAEFSGAIMPSRGLLETVGNAEPNALTQVAAKRPAAAVAASGAGMNMDAFAGLEKMETTMTKAVAPNPPANPTAAATTAGAAALTLTRFQMPTTTTAVASVMVDAKKADDGATSTATSSMAEPEKFVEESGPCPSGTAAASLSAPRAATHNKNSFGGASGGDSSLNIFTSQSGLEAWPSTRDGELSPGIVTVAEAAALMGSNSGLRFASGSSWTTTTTSAMADADRGSSSIPASSPLFGSNTAGDPLLDTTWSMYETPPGDGGGAELGTGPRLSGAAMAAGVVTGSRGAACSPFPVADAFLSPPLGNGVRRLSAERSRAASAAAAAAAAAVNAGRLALGDDSDACRSSTAVEERQRPQQQQQQQQSSADGNHAGVAVVGTAGRNSYSASDGELPISNATDNRCNKPSSRTRERETDEENDGGVGGIDRKKIATTVVAAPEVEAFPEVPEVLQAPETTEGADGQHTDDVVAPPPAPVASESESGGTPALSQLTPFVGDEGQSGGVRESGTSSDGAGTDIAAVVVQEGRHGRGGSSNKPGSVIGTGGGADSGVGGGRRGKHRRGGGGGCCILA